MDTRTILDRFAWINQFPRCPKNENALRSAICRWADASGFDHIRDAAGNLLVRVPANDALPSAPILVIQGHMDMVCEKTPVSDHDFTADPIELIFDGDWVRAKDTTLGADNGIALALAMVLAEQDNLPRPPLELLFTVEEETGLNGALALEPGFLQGRRLLNIDSEEEGVFTVGCASGRDADISLKITPESLRKEMTLFHLAVGGMSGGHSGIDIHRQRANAIKTLARVLAALLSKTDLRLVTIKGGTVKNAIPREAGAVVAVSGGKLEQLQKVANRLRTHIVTEHAHTDPDFQLTWDKMADGTSFEEMLTAADTLRVVQLLQALPDGAQKMWQLPPAPEVVETSCNVARVSLDNRHFAVLNSMRSLRASRLDLLSARIASVVALAGGDITFGGDYPPWLPDADAEILSRCRTIYENLFAKAPEISIIHAGIECAVIGNQYDGMEMISFGPDIRNPHSPSEKMRISSVGRIWDFLTALVGYYAKGFNHQLGRR